MPDSPDPTRPDGDGVPGLFDGFIAADDDHVRREKARARELRQSAWWKNVLGRGACHYCGRHVHPHDLTMDHVVPIIRGGRSTRGNVVPCCKDCNSRKRNLVPAEWEDYLRQLAARSRLRR